MSKTITGRNQSSNIFPDVANQKTKSHLKKKRNDVHSSERKRMFGSKKDCIYNFSRSQFSTKAFGLF